MSRRSILVIAAILLVAAPSIAADKFFPLDLQPYANAKTDDHVNSSGTKCDMAELTAGDQVLADIQFRIGKKHIQLGSSIEGLKEMPQRVVGISVGRRFAKLHFLHATSYGGGPNQPGDPGYVEDGTLIGEYRLNFKDHSAIIIPIIYGTDVRDWFFIAGEKEPYGSRVAWIGDTPFAGLVNSRIRLYLTTWENPWSDKTVVSIDYSSRKSETVAAPFCVAITAEEE